MKHLLTFKEPESIYYCSKPLPQTKEEAIKLVPIAEINKLFSKHRNLKFTWTNNVLIPDDWQFTEKDQALLAEYQKRMIPLDCFVICYINDDVGYGIFNRKKIRKGDILFYSGEFIHSANQILKYGLGTPDAAVDGEKIGGITSLFQDLYNPIIPLTDFPLEVARFNFCAKDIKFSQGSIPIFEAITDVELYSQCGISYSKKYWQTADLLLHLQKQYFTTKGDVIFKIFADYLRLKELTNEQADASEKSSTTMTNSLGLSPGATRIEQHIPGDRKFFEILKYQNYNKQKQESQQLPPPEQSFEFMKGVLLSSKKKVINTEKKTSLITNIMWQPSKPESLEKIEERKKKETGFGGMKKGFLSNN